MIEPARRARIFPMMLEIVRRYVEEFVEFTDAQEGELDY